jgi:hypothetical protein
LGEQTQHKDFAVVALILLGSLGVIDEVQLG